MISTILGEDGDAAFYRVIAATHIHTPLSGMGAARQGGRQAHPGGINLVIYRSSGRPSSQLRVYDPEGALR